MSGSVGALGKRRLTVRVGGGLNVPKRVGHDCLLVASNFLLLERPFRELDLVGEQVAARHGVLQPELRPERSDALRRLPIAPVTLVDLDNPVVVRVTRVAGDAVARDFILELDVGDGRANIVRVQRLLSLNVPELDASTFGDVGDAVVLPGGVRVSGRGSVNDAPVVVRVTVRVQGNLLLCVAKMVLIGKLASMLSQ